MKKITQQSMQATNTRCENIHKRLELEVQELYKERWDLLKDMKYFYSINEHQKLPKLDLNLLNETRASIMLKILKIDKKIEDKCNAMIKNHAKYYKKLLAWKKQQKSIVTQGFKINK